MDNQISSSKYQGANKGLSSKYQGAKYQTTKSGKVFDLQERTAIFSERVIHFCRCLKLDSVSRPLVSQLVRSSTSIGANYTEANSASSRKDFRNKVFISKKEAQETRYWLRLLSPLVDDTQELNDLSEECQELIQILQSISSKVSDKGNV